MEHRSIAATAAGNDEAARTSVDQVPNDALEGERRRAPCDECAGMSSQVDVHLQGRLRSKDVTAQGIVDSRGTELLRDLRQLDTEPLDDVLHPASC
jgi:hypothetical protein